MHKKETKAAVNYRRGTKSKHCGICTMYRSGGPANWGTCTDVEGSIDPQGVCDIFKKKVAA